MTETESKYIHGRLTEALVAAQAEFGVVAKDTANPFFKSTYADLPAVMKEAQPVLAKHGLAVTQLPSYTVIEGKPYDTLRTVVVWEGGASGWDSITSEMILRPVKNDPQAQGSAITYARRYAYMAVLGLVADNDDDGNAASGRAKSRPKPAPNADDAQTAAVRKALAVVKDAVKEAGQTSKEATAYFKEKYGENLLTSTNVEALSATADHYRELVAKNVLGAEEK
ncbi:ERF family protein [Mycolicibacterium palauense]|uniref:ERF family protein n=1 Tax=Mycolicibacterium palauense TaxID=2034511 RepID=UPI000BFEC129|nr:ERF family protein [Mycolicibacterium palauense]